MLKALSLGIQWISGGPDGKLRTDVEPGLVASVVAGQSNVGWGQEVKFDLDPLGDTPMGRGLAPGTDPSKGWPTISWFVQVAGEDGVVMGTATLTANPDAEGEVDLAGLPIDIGTRPYDQTLGYGIKVTAGAGKQHKPASSGRLRITVWAKDELSGIVSNHLSYFVS